MKISSTYFDSPLGMIYLEANDEALLKVEFVEQHSSSISMNPILSEAQKQLLEYFSGERRSFDLPVKFQGTVFQEKVWKALQKIPFGETKTYQEIAEEIGHNNAYRAVGSANNKNQFAIIVPCHRVIAKSGSMAGYNGGLDKKESLLSFEGL
ncbi:MAG: methylated-DNA--[protein]-cysteine S-methyltransferase [Brevinema sp.]